MCTAALLLEDLHDIMITSDFSLPQVDIGPPSMAGVTGGKTLSETFMEEVKRVRAEAYEWQIWAINEIRYWKDRCEDLEAELIMADSLDHSQDVDPGLIKIKERKLIK